MWNPFSRVKESPIAGVTVSAYGGRPQYRTIDVEGYAREGYMANPDVYAAIEIFSNAAGAVDWGVEKRVRGKWEPLDTHPMLDLLERPNPKSSGTRLIRDLVKWRLIGGEFYLGRNEKPSGPPKELWILPVHRMRIKPGTSPLDPVAGYTYSLKGRVQDLDADLVLHLPRFHPLDDFYGLPPLQAVALMIDQATSAAEFNLGLLQNGGIPPLFLVSDDELEDKAFQRLKKAISLWGTAGQANKPQLLEGGLKPTSMSRTPADMEMLAAQRMFALKFAQVIGVPAEFLSGADEKKYANAEEAKKALYTEGVLPELDDIRDGLNAWLSPQFDNDVRLVYLTDSIDALQENMEKAWARADASTDLTIDETRAIKGFEPLPGGVGDVLLVPFSVAPLASVVNPPAADVSTPDADPAAEGKSLKSKALDMPDDRKAAYWKRVDTQRSRVLPNATRAFADQLKTETAAIVAAIGDAPTPPAALSRALKAIDAGKPAWERTLIDVAVKSAAPFAEQTLNELGQTEKSKGAIDWASLVVKYVRKTVARRVVQVTDSTKNEIKAIVEESVNDGLSVYEMGQLIEKQRLEQIIPRRSEVIARTEVVRASNAGSVAAATATGLDLRKEWITTRDGRERSAHEGVDGETVALDEAFSVDGDELDFPGDDSYGADAGNVIQCRCTVGYVSA